MPTTFRKNLAALALAALPLIVAAAPAKPDEAVEAAITQQLRSYEQALNNADIEAVMKLYGEDSVFMPQNSLNGEELQALREYLMSLN